VVSPFSVRGMTTTLIRRAGVPALLAATIVSLTGCAGVLGARMTYDDTEKAKITDIVLSGGSGSVLVRTAAVTETSIKRVIRRSTNPGESYQVNGSTLAIDTSCGHNCSVQYEIVAPAGVTVHGVLRSGDVSLDGVGATDVEVSSGDLMIKNATGPVQAKATSGDITVTGATGAVRTEASSGDVRVMNVAGPVTATVRSGDLDVKLTTANSVTADSSSGDVNVTVPKDSYQIRTDTSSGDANIHGLINDASAKNVLDLKASSGDVTVTATA
jgi:DUF4097 and DUF4098 domain-containing protein YvlB